LINDNNGRESTHTRRSSVMVTVFVIYDTKHGNTKLVAEKIVEGLREVGGMVTSISDV